MSRTTLRLMDVYTREEASKLSKWLFIDCFEWAPGKEAEVFVYIEKLEEYVRRLLKREPLPYISGKVHFYDLVLDINHHVLIPRPETEELVHWILSDYRDDRRQLDCLDIGTGSGCIAVTLKTHKMNWRVFGIEYSLDALNVTRINARKHKAPVEMLRMNFLDTSMWSHLGLLDLIVSNPPYVSDDEKGVVADNVLLYEPEMALFAGGDDPLIFYRRIHELAERRLRPGGRVYVEMNEFKAQEISDLFSSDRIEEINMRKDMQGKARMLCVQYE